MLRSAVWCAWSQLVKHHICKRRRQHGALVARNKNLRRMVLASWSHISTHVIAHRDHRQKVVGLGDQLHQMTRRHVLILCIELWTSYLGEQAQLGVNERHIRSESVQSRELLRLEMMQQQSQCKARHKETLHA